MHSLERTTSDERSPIQPAVRGVEGRSSRAGREAVGGGSRHFGFGGQHGTIRFGICGSAGAVWARGRVLFGRGGRSERRAGDGAGGRSRFRLIGIASCGREGLPGCPGRRAGGSGLDARSVCRGGTGARFPGRGVRNRAGRAGALVGRGAVARAGRVDGSRFGQGLPAGRQPGSRERCGRPVRRAAIQDQQPVMGRGPGPSERTCQGECT